MKCPQCYFDNLADFRFCGQCGSELGDLKPGDGLSTESWAERKHVTILFSDLCGYTRLTESIDPEEVKAIMGKMFAEGARIVQKYSGVVERFFGDEILAVFGSPIAHEDDALRAIRVAMEIHAAVKVIDRQIRERIGFPLAMHTGINTGIVVTDIKTQDPFSYGITGDAVILAKGLQGLANPGEILIGPETYQQTAGYFSFHPLELQHVKGKKEPIKVYKVLAPKPVPRKVHRTYGRRAELTGRKEELDTLTKAAADLRQKMGRILCICGTAGIGKSRLVEDFKVSLDQDVFRWCEGFGYPYTQNISYFPFIDLLRRQFQILEEDLPEAIQQKIEAGTTQYLSNPNVSTYVGGLFSLDYPTSVSDPENWKTHLQEAICLYFSSLARTQPLIVCLEDLHWYDPSSLDLIHTILAKCDYPALFLLVYRTPSPNIEHRFSEGVEPPVNLIELQEFSLSDTWQMIRSLLQTEEVPTGLQQFIEKNIQGNPFYLEEIINSLVESKTLVLSGGVWKLTRPIGESGIALTIRGLITGRLDRLRPELKEVLREASVFGSSFQYDVLKKVSGKGSRLGQDLDELTCLDILRLSSTSPNVEYSFKHVMTREVVYDGLLKSERQSIHERIGRVIEELFQGRLAEYYETLAFHFNKGKSFHKAVHYLMQSGRKSLRRYAVEESHQFYKAAYDILVRLDSQLLVDRNLLIEILVYWFPVYYYRGRFESLEAIMNAHLDLAETIEDKELQGMYYVGVGMCLWGREKFRGSYQYMHKALSLGKEVDSKKLQGYARAWLAWICVELGFLDEAIEHGEISRKMADHFESDHYPYYHSLDSDGFAYWAKGDSRKIHDCGEALLEYGLGQSSIRGVTWGHSVKGWGHLAAGDMPAAVKCNQQALQASADPFYTMFPKLFLGVSYVFARQFEAGKAPLLEVSEYARLYGSEILGSVAHLFLSVIFLFEGQLRKGVEQINKLQKYWEKNDARWRQVNSELVLGEIYLGMIRRDVPIAWSTILRNLGFLIKTVPFAARRAEYYYQRALKNAESIGAKGIQGQAYLGMGYLYKAIGKPTKASTCLDAAIEVFRQCDATAFLQLAETTKAALINS